MEILDPVPLPPGDPTPSIQRPRPWLAGLWNFIFPGLGEVYGGDVRRGVLVYWFFNCLHYPVLAVIGAFHFRGLVASILGGLVLYVWSIWDAVQVARKAPLKRQTKQRYMVFFGNMVVFISLSLVFRDRLPELKGYKIPAGSMQPTLMIGDHMMCQMSSGPFRRGEIVIFKYPEDQNRDFIKRIIGVEGDEIRIEKKELFVNGKKMVESYVEHNSADIIDPIYSPRDTMYPFKVKPGHVFLLGDNRDNSHDSRFWGQASVDLIRAKALFIYFAKDWSRIGTDIH